MIFPRNPLPGLLLESELAKEEAADDVTVVDDDVIVDVDEFDSCCEEIEFAIDRGDDDVTTELDDVIGGVFNDDAIGGKTAAEGIGGTFDDFSLNALPI